MPKAWIRYLILAGVRCVTFYAAIGLVQYMFDGKVNWGPNLLLAIPFAILLTYMQARWKYIQQLRQAQKAKGAGK